MNKLQWANRDLNQQLFSASQRGRRLAEKLGYDSLEDAEAAFATQAGDGSESQLNKLSPNELAQHFQSLQGELSEHVALSKASLGAFDDAMKELHVLKEDNEGLRKELMERDAEHDRSVERQTSSVGIHQQEQNIHARGLVR